MAFAGQLEARLEDTPPRISNGEIEYDRAYIEEAPNAWNTSRRNYCRVNAIRSP
jgi:hypothetical protein